MKIMKYEVVVVSEEDKEDREVMISFVGPERQRVQVDLHVEELAPTSNTGATAYI